jgi:hypothetical protein
MTTFKRSSSGIFFGRECARGTGRQLQTLKNDDTKKIFQFNILWERVWPGDRQTGLQTNGGHFSQERYDKIAT